MDILIQAATRQDLITGLAKLKLPLVFYNNGVQDILPVSQYHSSFFFGPLAGRPVELDAEGNLISDAEWLPGVFLGVRAHVTLQEAMAQADWASVGLSRRNPVNPTEVLV